MGWFSRGISAGADAGADMYKQQAEDNRKLFMQKHLQEEGYKEAREVATAAYQRSQLDRGEDHLNKVILANLNNESRRDLQGDKLSHQAEQQTSKFTYQTDSREDEQSWKSGENALTRGQQLTLQDDKQDHQVTQQRTKFGNDKTLLNIKQNNAEKQLQIKYSQSVAMQGLNAATAVTTAATAHTNAKEQLVLKNKHAYALLDLEAKKAWEKDTQFYGYAKQEGFTGEVADATALVFSKTWGDYVKAMDDAAGYGTSDAMSEEEYGKRKASFSATLSQNVKALRAGVYNDNPALLNYNVSSAEMSALIVTSPPDAKGDVRLFVPRVRKEVLNTAYIKERKLQSAYTSTLYSPESIDAEKNEENQGRMKAINAKAMGLMRESKAAFLRSTGIQYSTDGLPAIWTK